MTAQWERYAALAEHYRAIGMYEIYLEKSDNAPYHLVYSVQFPSVQALGFKDVSSYSLVVLARIAPELSATWVVKIFEGARLSPDLKRLLKESPPEVERAIAEGLRPVLGAVNQRAQEARERLAGYNACLTALEALYTL